MKYIDEANDMEGKLVLLRLDLNVPVSDGVVVDTYRIEKIIETIDFLRDKKARTIIISHCEGGEGIPTLLPMWQHLNGYFPVDFCPTYFTPESIEKVLKLEEGGVLMFENLRINEGEKANNPEFAKKLAQMADIYINDAFAVCHRKHASIVGVPEHLPSYGGLLLRQEIDNLSKAFQPEHPFIFILGGAKFETKIPLIEKYITIADNVFVGGALVHNIFKEKGLEIGTSKVSPLEWNMDSIINNEKLITPVDVTVANGTEVMFKTPDEVGKGDCIVDAGPRTVEELKKILQGAKTIVWNGSLGNYEKGFGDKTEQIAELIASQTAKGSKTIVGGGDTVVSICKMDLQDKFSFVSTGGGAMLDFLRNETLPGIEALNNSDIS